MKLYLSKIALNSSFGLNACLQSRFLKILNIQKRGGFFLFLLFSQLFMQAAPMRDKPVKIVQPNGDTISCFVSGDEFFNRLHDANNYTFIQATDGYYCYAEYVGEKVVASEFRVNTVDPSKVGIKPNVSISKTEYQHRKTQFASKLKNSKLPPVNAPQTGTMNNLVIYIRFANENEIVSTREKNEDRFSSLVEPSVKLYYKEVSYDKSTINSYHFPECNNPLTSNSSYMDAHNRNYFKPYNETTNPTGYKNDDEREEREHTLLRDAINWINENSPVPANLNLDADNDGLIDCLSFIIKGDNTEWNDLLWAHAWSLYSYDIEINNKKVLNYIFLPESEVNVRTICHEIFHLLGAPDLYHYSHDNLNPVGYWDLMEYGSGHMTAYMKWKYSSERWITNIPEITKSGTYTLNPITEEFNNCFKIASSYSATEFFVVEFRKDEGLFEQNLPGAGLIVYRINPTSRGNSDGPPDELYIYRLSGTKSENGKFNSANFSQLVGRTAINDFTNPSSFLTNGTKGGLNISNVMQFGSTLSFDIEITPNDIVHSAFSPNVKLSPVPVDNTLHIESESKIESIEIIDINGVSLQSETGVNKQQTDLDLSKISKGFYECKIIVKGSYKPVIKHIVKK